jgi:hypothetical protein
MGYPTCENRRVAGSDKWIIGAGGTLEFEEGATVTGLVATATFATAAEVKTATEEAKVISPKILADGLGDYASKIILGTLSSSNDTSGIPLSAVVNKAFAVHADSGGSALTAGNIRAALMRMLIGTAISGGADISTYGMEALLKSRVSVNVGGNQAGVLGHYESVNTITLTGSINTVKAGVASFLDLAANATVAAGTVMSAFGVNPANFGTTMNGRTAIIHVTNPMAGTWGSFLDLSTATGCTQDSAAGAVGDKFLKVCLNGVLYTIAMARAA